MDNREKAEEALEKLKKGNAEWISEGRKGDLSRESVNALAGGQSPYAVVVTCSDSRVVPEAIFAASSGDIFVVRAAGNTIGAEALGSIEYAAEHLGSSLVLVMGHTGCGAVGAALEHGGGRFIPAIIKDISEAAGDERDPYRACCLNVHASAEKVRRAFEGQEDAPLVAEAVFHIEDGTVEFL
jgi:carbonic anhydrase